MLERVISSRLVRRKLWRLGLVLLVLANVAYFLPPPLGWVLTLVFFCFMPGYLILRLLRHTITLHWEVVVFSLGLSLLFLMLCGLALNSLHYAGLHAPLQAPGIFAVLDAATLLLLYFTRHKTLRIPPRLPMGGRQIAALASLSLLPFIAAGGAIQLNNGVASVLPLVVFGIIALVFVVLAWRPSQARAYPYVLFIFALSILLTVSMRGESVTGHDIQREFHVFELASQSGFWDIQRFTDPYNACISITILPTLMAKMTGIADAYIFKVVFQIIFAFSIIPIYYFMKRLASAQTAFMGSFLFLAFPTFLNDMAMLNRQEIGMLFFSLIMVLVLTELPRQQKKILTILFLVGIILAHYSSGYIVLSLLFLSWLVYLLISKLYKRSAKERLTLLFPTLNIVIIFTGLLFTFLWNFQITGTTAGLEKTASKTFTGLFEKSDARSNDVSYSLLGGAGKAPGELLNSYVAASPGGSVPVEYVAPYKLPLTGLGEWVSKAVNVESIHAFIRNVSAKFLQVMLLVGCVALAVVYRKRILSQHETYFLALIVTSAVLLVLQIALPQLSVDYGTLRLFQQLLVILAIPIVVGIIALFYGARRWATRLAGVVLALLFLHLSGFLPQLTGGYPPQLALNNAGIYYDSYYVDSGEKSAAAWLMAHNIPPIGVAADPYALLRFTTEERARMPLTSPFTDSTKAFVYKDRVNKTSGLFLINLNSNLYYYRVKRTHARENCLYSTPTADVCKLVEARP